MNVKKKDLESILKILPAEKSPTISSLADEDYVAIEVILKSVCGYTVAYNIDKQTLAIKGAHIK